MKSKGYTPGPWQVGKHDTAENHTWIQTGSVLFLGVAKVYGDTSQETEANARLIGAAPELLEALKRAHARLLALSSNETDENENVDDIEALLLRVEKE